LVLDLISSAAYQPPDQSGRAVYVVGRQATCDILAFVGQSDEGTSLTIKRMTPRPPDAVRFEHLTGRFAGAVEHIRLRTVRGGTFVLAEADLEPVDGLSPKAQLYLVESSVSEMLEKIRTAVEALARSGGYTPEHPSGRVGVPMFGTIEQLIELSDSQEVAEWGHVGHGKGVERVAKFLARATGIDEQALSTVGLAARLHDIGKLAIDSRLWGHSGPLSPGQRVLLHDHAQLGAELIACIGLPDPIGSAIRHHHERWDGGGYPDNLAGDAIPLPARILSVAENVDSMLRSSYRRESIPLLQARAMLEDGAGKAWDPDLVRQLAPILHD
jgi:putative nucleotidyltransferase with HDIG domain